LVLASPSGVSPLRPICSMSSKASPDPCRSTQKPDYLFQHPDVLLGGRGHGAPGCWVYAENIPLQVLGVPLAPPPKSGPGGTTPRRRFCCSWLLVSAVALCFKSPTANPRSWRANRDTESQALVFRFIGRGSRFEVRGSILGPVARWPLRGSKQNETAGQAN